MGRLVVVLLLLGVLACASPRPAPPAAAPASGRVVRLATWNLHNLFDTVDDPYGDDVLSEPELEGKLAGLCAVLEEVDADLLAVQEVENAEVLEALATRCGGYPYRVLEEGNDTRRGIDVAFLSRLPLEGYRSHKDEPLPHVSGAPRGYRFSRDCLEVRVGGSPPLVVLVNHFKSKQPAGRRSDAKRRAQAMGVARIVERLEREEPGVRLAVAGDLNDGPDSWALEPLFQGRLVDLLAGLPPEQRYTLVHRGRPMVLDHLLANPSMQASVVEGSARVLHTDAAHRASDHYPAAVDVRW